MKWFKHESSAGDSPRLRRLRARYGAEGYGLYWFLVEQVGVGWETHGADINPSLEIEDIESELRIPSGQSPDMIRWMIDKGLFEASTIGLLRCESLRNHVGEAQRKAERRDRPKLNSGHAPDSVRIVSGPTPEKEEIRVEEKREEKKKNTPPQAEPAGVGVPLALDLGPAQTKANTAKERFEKFWTVVRKKVGKKMAMAEFLKVNPDDALLEKMIRSMTAYNKSNDDVTKLKDPERWIKAERWNDELLVVNGAGKVGDDIFAGCEKV